MTRRSFRLWRSQNYASGKSASVGGLFQFERPHMHNPDMPQWSNDVCCWGVERTCRLSGPTSEFDPKQAWAAYV